MYRPANTVTLRYTDEKENFKITCVSAGSCYVSVPLLIIDRFTTITAVLVFKHLKFLFFKNHFLKFRTITTDSHYVSFDIFNTVKPQPLHVLIPILDGRSVTRKFLKLMTKILIEAPRNLKS